MSKSVQRRKKIMRKEKSAGELYVTLIEAISALGWHLAIPKLRGDQIVPGMVIGTDEYINAVLKQVKKPLYFSVRNKA